MSANDKTKATFHGADRGSDYESAIMGQMTPQEIDEARRSELSQADWPIEPGKLVPMSPEWLEFDQPGLIGAGLLALIQQSGENSRDHGFHEDFPGADGNSSFDQGELNLAVTQKLMLINEEIVEAFGEIRSGRKTKEIYFVDNKGHAGSPSPNFEYNRQYYGLPGSDRHPEEKPCREGDVPLLKPEGMLVELADAVIRIADLVFLLNGQEEFIEALHAKHEYNKTRPFKHGRQF